MRKFIAVLFAKKPAALQAVPAKPVLRLESLEVREVPAVAWVKVGPQPEPPTEPIPTFAPAQELRGILLPSLTPVRGVIGPGVKPGAHTNPEFKPASEVLGILLPSLRPTWNTNPEILPTPVPAGHLPRPTTRSP